MVRKWFDAGIFCVLRCMHFVPILALLAIALLAKVNWDATRIKSFKFEYQRLKYIFISPVPSVTRYREDRKKHTKGGHHEICLIYCVEFADRIMFRYSADQYWNFFLEKSDDYTEYPMLEEQDRETGYWNWPVAFERAQGNLKTGVHTNIDHLPEDAGEGDNWEYDNAVGN